MVAELSSLTLLLMLGLRHGLEADHVVMINGLTLNASRRGQATAPWVGSFFAVGHGLMIVLVSLLIHQLARAQLLPPWVVEAAGGLSLVLVFVVGLVNLHGLFGRDEFRPRGWKQQLIPERLRHGSGAWPAIVAGVLFALMFDTLAISALICSLPAAPAGPFVIIALGLIFTVGMAISETLDSYLLCRALAATDRPRLQRRQRAIGFLIVGLSFATVAIGVIERAS